MPPRAKTGEGIVAVVDVGNSVCASTDTTFLTSAKECLTRLLQRKIFADKCHDLVGIVLFGTSATDNHLATDDGFQHVTVLRELVGVNWDIIEKVQTLRCGGSSGDWLDAVVVAMDMLHNHDPHSGVILEGKKIVLFTDFGSEFSESRYEEVTAGLRASEINLVVIGPEFCEDDTENEEEEDKPGTSNGGDNDTKPPKRPTLNWNGKPKTVVQLAGETLAAEMVAKSDGLLCTFEEAMSQLMYFEKKNQGSAFWNTTLDIGPEFKIPITGRIKVRQTTLPTWKKAYKEDPTKFVSKEVSHHLLDERQTEVPEEEVIHGYLFGTTLVPCSDEDMSRMYNSDSPRSMTVVGFTEASRVPHRLRVGNQVLVVTARARDKPAAVALSALIHALVELDMVAITRRVYNKNSNPKMGALFPEITKDRECLMWIQLPYSQEMQRLAFPSLQNRMDKLKAKEKQAMDSLIDAMTLSEAWEDDDDGDEELHPREVLNPRMQHFYNSLTHRALNPGEKGIPRPAPHILSILQPPERVIEARDKVAEELKKLFPTKVVASAPKRTRNVFDVEETTKEGGEKKVKIDDSLSASDLAQHQVTGVTTATPVHDFMVLLRREAPDFNDICKQMGQVVLLLMDSLVGAFSTVIANATLEKVVQCLKAFRQESLIINPATYNTFLPNLKDVVTSNSQNDLWEKLKEGGLGLITTEENGRSSVGPDEANAFLQLGQDAPAAAPAVQDIPDDMQDLLDEL